MYVERHSVEIETDASGDATAYTPVVTGMIQQVRYVPDGTAPLDTGADVDITGDTSGIVIFDKDNIGTSAFAVAPRQPTHDTGGVASLYAAAGEPVEDRIAVALERLKVVVAQGGASKTGTFHIYVV